MTTTKPSLALLREMSDEAVLRALMDSPRLTRAELAVLTGLSKPTVGEAVRRLEAAALVRDTGERTTGRGGVGTYYALAGDVGLALAVSIAPQGVAVEVLNAAGGVTGRAVEPVRRRPSPEAVDRRARPRPRAARSVTAGRAWPRCPPPTPSTRQRVSSSTCPMRRSCSAPCPRPRRSRRSSTGRSSSTTT